MLIKLIIMLGTVHVFVNYCKENDHEEIWSAGNQKPMTAGI
jgi:hypothetical protein